MGDNDDFFDAFPDGIQVDWSKISSDDLNKMMDTLNKQDVEKIFNSLQEAIDLNDKRKSIVDVTLKVLQVAINLGMKIAK
jgi:pyoverdine/dityrosine biosynthesis protein Dit1